ncbi:alpha/beta hydrolase fold domain-containing protein [Dermabacteraceae bacterium P13101]
MEHAREIAAKVVSSTTQTVKRIPIPGPVYTSSLRTARRSLPGVGVQRKHAVDVEMINRTRTVWLDRHRRENGLIVYLHGGAFVAGPFPGDWQWLSRQAEALDCAALLIDYRYAPDHQHPVAAQDVDAVLSEIAATGEKWVLAAHNSGGGLALNACRRLAQQQLTQPSALVLMTPWTDLSLSNTLLATAEPTSDSVHERRTHEAGAAAYAGRTPLDAVELSLCGADLHGLPKTHLSCGTKDFLGTDARVLKLQLQEAQVAVSYREIGGRLNFLPLLRKGPDATRLFNEQRDFMAAALAGK